MDAWFPIASWQVDAIGDDMSRYFFITREFNDIMSGHHCLVVGGKGTGKTALSRYLETRSAPEAPCRRLGSSDYRFANFFDRAQKSPAARECYVQLWRHYILKTALEMVRDAGISANQDGLGRKANSFYNQCITFLGGFQFLKELIGDYGALSDPGTEQARAEINHLDKLVKKWANKRRFIIIFDELDEGYTGQTEYLECYRALVDACELFARDKQSPVKPIVLLRDDIYDALPGGRGGKWTDIKVELKWDLPTIKRLLAFRIARAFDENMAQEEPSFSAEWGRLFSPGKVTDGQKQVEKFDFIAERTLGRPRDYIKFIQECAKLMRDDEESLEYVDANILTNAEEPYSAYLWAELRDLATPHCNDGTFAAIKKTAPNFTLENFRSALAAVSSIEGTHEKALHELRILSKLEVISDLEESHSGSFTVHKGLFFHLCPPKNC